MPEATVNGFVHHWEELGTGEPLVLLHGAAGAGASLMDHAKELADHLRILIPDMRGMGKSQRVSHIPPEAWVVDLKGLLDHLNIDRAHLYGTSLGTRVALKFAIEFPERTASVILDNAIIAFEAAGSGVMNQRLDPDSMDAAAAARYEGLHGPDWKDAVRTYFAWRNDPEVHAYFDLREASKGLQVPLLITRGNVREPVHPMSHSFELFENCPNATLWIKPEGGCFATSEGYERVRNFIAEAKSPALVEQANR